MEKRKYKKTFILSGLSLSILFLTSCAGTGQSLMGSTDFGIGIKIPNILLYIVVFGALGWYLFGKKK